MSTSTAQLIANDLVKSHGSAHVIDGVSLLVGPRSRIALLGPNGVGKTTLLRLLAGLDTPDSGRVERAPADATVGYLAQEPFGNPGESLRQMLARRTGVAEVQATLEKLEGGLSDNLEVIERYTATIERYRALGGYDLEGRAVEVCEELGLEESALDQEVNTLSGGQLTRAALAAIALARFEILLLDEPTNNLDLDGLTFLESYVRGFAGGLVVVSHDRAFLEATVDRFVELDQFTRRSSEFTGSWSDYELRREQIRERQKAEHDAGVAERDRLLRRARQMRTEATSGAVRARRRPVDNDKSIQFATTTGSQQHAAKAMGLERRASKVEIVDEPREPWKLRMDLAPAKRGSEVVLRLSGAVVQRGSFEIGPIDLEVGRTERLALAGPNGSGKTTLLEAVVGNLPLSSGSRVVGSGVMIGYAPQDRSGFVGEESLLEMFMAASGMRAEEVRSLLAKFELGADDVLRPGNELSAGERSRAELALLVADGANCLVLDEPTNHLDIPAIEELERSLGDFSGTLLVASHDRRLLERIGVTRKLELADGLLAARP